MKRFTAKHLKQEFFELDYWDKLSTEERQWMTQFMYEYYQADFNYVEVMHAKELRKECRDRNNAAKRQIHSVGSNLLLAARDRAMNITNGNNHMQKPRFYTPQDYKKDLSKEDSDDE